jgi:hypothetical protein
LVHGLAEMDKRGEEVFRVAAIILVKSRNIEVQTPGRVDLVSDTSIPHFIPTKKRTPVRQRSFL